MTAAASQNALQAQIRDTRAHIGTLISELQKRYVIVDGSEYDRLRELQEDQKADIVDKLVYIAAMKATAHEPEHPLEAHTLTRYLSQ